MDASPAQLLDFQMHGQDIPWLLAHWAEQQARPPGAGVGPARRRGPALDLRRAARRRAPARRRARRPRASPRATRCSSTPRTAPRWCWRGWPAPRSARSAVTTNTKSVGAEVTYFAEHTAQCVAAITQPQFAAMVAEAAPALKWIAVTDDNSGEPAAGDRAGFDRRCSRRRRRRGTAAPVEPMLPFGIMFTSGTTSRPKAVVHTHANADLGQPHRAPQHRPRHRRPLPDLPAVLPRERAELVVLLGARRRRDRGAHAEVVAEPLLADGRRSTASPTSR